MKACTSTRRALRAGVALALLAAIACPAAAQQSSNQSAAPGAGGQQRYDADPQALLADFPAGGMALSARVRAMTLRIALKDPNAVGAVVAKLIALAANGNDAQRAAIGAGLGAAAKALSLSNPALANAISSAVQSSTISALVAAFNAASAPTPSIVNADSGVDSNSTSGGPPVPYNPGEAPTTTELPSTSIFSGTSPPTGAGGMTNTIQSSVSPSRTSL